MSIGWLAAILHQLLHHDSIDDCLQSWLGFPEEACFPSSRVLQAGTPGTGRFFTYEDEMHLATEGVSHPTLRRHMYLVDSRIAMSQTHHTMPSQEDWHQVIAGSPSVVTFLDTSQGLL